MMDDHTRRVGALNRVDRLGSTEETQGGVLQVCCDSQSMAGLYRRATTSACLRSEVVNLNGSGSARQQVHMRNGPVTDPTSL